MIEHARKLIEPVMIYSGATLHYLMQLTEMERYEVAVNILVGLLVAVYTLQKIVSWFWKHAEERRERIHARRKKHTEKPPED